MEINYQNKRFPLFYQFEVAARHLNVAFMSNEKDAIQKAFQERVIASSNVKELSWGGRIKHLTLGLFEYIPVVGLIIALFDRWVNNRIESSIPIADPISDEKLLNLVKKTPKFTSYGFAADPKVHLTDLSERPMNLFHQALFKNSNHTTTIPSSNQLFRYIRGNKSVRKYIQSLDDNQVIEFSASNKIIIRYGRSGGNIVNIGFFPLKDYLGEAVFRISVKEIKDMLDSQKVFVSPLIPKKFYMGLKQALYQDGVVVLPGSERQMYMMKQFLKDNKYPYVKSFLESVGKNAADFGFVADGKMLSFKELMELTLYQLGAMVFKMEDYYSFLGDGLEIRKREVGAHDEINLISACGIRGFNTQQTKGVPNNQGHKIDGKIMKETFRGALMAAHEGYAVFPAVGMGVWRGDPDLYWRAFLDAVLSSDDQLEYIFVNPGHQPTSEGTHKGKTGEEFEAILEEYRRKYPNDPRLKKIVNLFDKKTDLLLLAQKLKLEFPNKRVSLFNASDPDVTLGNHVTEYANNLCHASTTEENYACAGTSSLGFEEITGVLENDAKVVQLS